MFFRYSSPKFFCSNGLLKEVSEVNKMNDSLQSELQVREEIGALRPCLNVLISICPCVCQKACLDVEESERLVEALQADILALRKKLGEKKQDATGEGQSLQNRVILHYQFQASWCCF